MIGTHSWSNVNMADSRKNSFAKIVLLILGVFIVATVIYIAVDTSKKKAPETVIVTNETLTNILQNRNVVVPAVEPIQPDEFYSATGTITEKQANVLTIDASVFINNQLVERTYTVEVTPDTVYTLIDLTSGTNTPITYGQLQSGDRVTFQAEDDLATAAHTIATMIDKLIN